MSDNWKAGEIADKTQILSYLETDRLYAAYAIGDLEPELYAQCTWAGAERDGRMRALALHFRGLKLPAFFLMGDPDGVHVILDGILHPARAYLTCRAEHLPAVGEFYVWEGEPRSMRRMSLRSRDIPSEGKTCVRMTSGHAEEIRKLVAQEDVSGFAAAQIEHGVFYGIYEDEMLVSVAGTHLVSRAYGVAAVGNVITQRQYRSRGYGKAAVSAVLSEMAEIGIRDIVLNVQKENAPAIHIYKKLGFECYCEFLEGPASSRSIGTSHRSVS